MNLENSTEKQRRKTKRAFVLRQRCFLVFEKIHPGTSAKNDSSNLLRLYSLSKEEIVMTMMMTMKNVWGFNKCDRLVRMADWTISGSINLSNGEKERRD